MTAKKIAGYALSLISLVGINFIPLDLLLYHDFTSESAMVFYALENVAAIIFSALFVLIFAPVQEVNLDYQRRAEILAKKPAFPVDPTRKKSEILRLYLVFSVGFSLATFVFLSVFVFLILKTRISADIILS